MIPRYSPAEIAEIFSDESRLRRWLEVELLTCEGWSLIGRVPEAAVARLRERATVDPSRVAALEARQGHDVAAFVSAVQESVGSDEARYIHLGITSSDVVDTALATQLRDAGTVVDASADALVAILERQSIRHRATVMPGRTHGVHAEPITLGVKLANHLDEVRRSRGRLAAAIREVSVGQVSGTVGTHATVPPAIEEHVCRELGLAVAPVTTQVVARDRHASLLAAIAILGAVLERLATTVRLLQITEVGELAEPFGADQKGSSAMPHKRNPVLCERICGMARVLRGYAATGLENVALWHERDISHSSGERVVLPDAFALITTMLRLAAEVSDGLAVDADRMRANLERDGGIVFSQQVLSALITDAGWSRERAYREVQELARRARAGEGPFRRLVEESEAGSALGVSRLARCFDLDEYLAEIETTFARLGLTVPGSADPIPAPGRGGADPTTAPVPGSAGPTPVPGRG